MFTRRKDGTWRRRDTMGRLCPVNRQGAKIAKPRVFTTSELYQVANPLSSHRRRLLLRTSTVHGQGCEYQDSRALGTWFWTHEWCTAYDESLVSLPITGYIMIPDTQRYIDPDFTEDLQEACTTGEGLVYHHIAEGG